jgi:atypical dual specificity phosphatase
VRLRADLIVPSLYISDMYIATSPTILAKLSITHVLCILDDPLPDYLSERTLDILFIELADTISSKIEDYFASSTAWIRDALADPNSKVLVHCGAGISRSATIVIAYLMATNGWGYSKAATHVRRMRPKIDPNCAFVVQLKRLESRLNDPAGNAENAPVERYGRKTKGGCTINLPERTP